MNNKYKVVLYNTEGTGTDVEEKVLKNNNIDNIDLLRIDGDKDELFMKEAADADGVVVVYTQMTKEVMSKLPQCKVITTHSIGVNQIDLGAATELGICVGNVPDYCVEEVAVHTIALMLDSARKITALDRSVRSGAWDVYAAGKLHRTKGKNYGLVSFGNIPRRVSQLVKAFGMNIFAYDPFVENAVFENYGVKRVDSIEELFGISDFVSVHSPLLSQTKHMIGKKQFEAAKDHMVLIATGRGGVINEHDLKAALESGKIAAAGVDVIEDEEANTCCLKNMSNVTMTPHSAYYSEDANEEVRVKAMMQINQVLNEKKLPTYLVNKEVDGNARFQK